MVLPAQDVNVRNNRDKHFLHIRAHNSSDSNVTRGSGLHFVGALYGEEYIIYLDTIFMLSQSYPKIGAQVDARFEPLFQMEVRFQRQVSIIIFPPVSNKLP